MEIAKEKKINGTIKYDLITLEKEMAFKRIYVRGLLFHEIGMTSDTVKFSVIYEISENFYRDQLETGTLPDSDQLHICFVEFGKSKEKNNSKLVEIQDQMKRI